MFTPNAFLDPENVGIEPKFIVLSQSVQNLCRVKFFKITAKYAYLTVISKIKLAVDFEPIKIER